MILGYRLFCKGIGVSAARGSGSSIESSIGISKFTIRNAAPGTAFALFGAILLIVTMVQGSPSVTLDTLTKWQPKDGTGEISESEQSQKLVMRGNAQDSMSVLVAQGIDFDRRGDTANAQRSYENAVKQIAEPINNLAWIYFNSGRSKDAVGLATLAVQLRPDEQRYLDTLQKARSAVR